MIVSLSLGRKGSSGFPGKNTALVLGKPLSSYSLTAAQESGVVDRLYLSTDDPELMDVARSLRVEVIERPAHLCTKEALGEDAYKHGLDVIRERLGEDPELLVLLFCNAPTVTPAQVREAVDVMRKRPEYDSAITVSRYNMYSPIRARRIAPNGLLEPSVPFEYFGGANVNCDRDSLGDFWYADVALTVIRPRNLDNMESGLPPQKWMGKKIFPIRNEAGLDVDYEWQLGQVEWWLKRYRAESHGT